ncbi:MAG: guanylate kinase [Omnitrophica WOR_2 bacterium RIFCSPLOWO2_02_FULL_45_28]|nr:MAG: guanylate kinase [Omnitrophica WOR_2 bacterium RIFCSPLOWO2_02_FULL_45_28]
MNNKRKGKIFIVSGSSGSGKTTLLKRLASLKEFRGNLVKIITATTREPRDLEKDGRDYYFLGREKFLRRLHNGEFIESQEIYSDYYATPKKDLLKVINAGRDALLCIDVQGTLALKRLFPHDAVLIFIKVPALKSLRERLHLRSSETKESLAKRLEIAKEEIGYARYYDYIIVNDVLKGALKKIAAVITAERSKAK